jgi:2,4-dienoyl-CoA reductase-like NADH-dependent reductase (Old Yellow Enzyme family)
VRHLFDSFAIGGLSLANRIIVAPMCQYSAVDGCATDWHTIHLGHLALCGAGLLTIEAAAVEAQGRISNADLGIYNDANAAALARVLTSIRAYSPIRVALQLAHAGRKASVQVPWEGGRQIAPAAADGWKTIAPSAVPHNPGDDAPIALDRPGMDRVREHFAQAARRAALIGVEGIEIHAAHGYLLHEFLSPVANRREDEYGGSLDNRMRFPLEIYDAVRHAFPAERPVWMRLSASDWVPNGWNIDEAVVFAQALERRGCAAIHVSSGGVSSLQKIDAVPGYQVPFAARIKRETGGVPVIAVGMITQARQAQDIIARDQADAIALARAMLYDPRWPWHAAAELGARVFAPKQYLRSQPAEYKDLFRKE